VRGDNKHNQSRKMNKAGNPGTKNILGNILLFPLTNKVRGY